MACRGPLPSLPSCVPPPAPLSCLTALLFAGCAVPPDPEPPLSVPAAFRTPLAGEVPSARWWESFADPRLDRRVARALRHNFDLRQAWERLRAAEALIGVEAGARLPQLEAFAGAAYTKTETGSSKSYELGLGASYEVDLWGRIGAQVDAAAERAEALFFDHQAAAQTLAAAVASTWFRLVEARQQRALLGAQLDANERALASLNNRFGGGLVRSADLLRQRRLVEGTKEEILAVEARMATLRNALAVLEGRAPEAAAELQAGGLPDLPPTPGTGIPAELLARRPDVRAAFFVVKASQSELAVAMTNRYPRLNLGASLSSAAGSPADLFDDWIRAVAGDLVGPLFAGGSLDAEVRRNEALVRGQVLAYGQVVLGALQEVEDALVRERSQVAIIDSLARQAELSQNAYQRLRIEYLNGVSGFLDLLSALVEAQRLQRDLLAARRLLLEYRIDLYRSLAGNFEVDRGLLEAMYQDPVAPRS